ncbi:hypothetical protein CXB51_014242 [Gossypium anomalum]|uniref:DUF7745 domain-containing protein n=1 Tax=Gossypium anomalum TaxID=47600 RepID=A0A8J5YRB1_9ROSI|nr:hypothetical protein CXB51_014242 [Gossypium anomalum]
MTVVVTTLSGSEKLRFREVFTFEPIIGEDRGIYWFRLESFVMRNEYLDKVEDNASNEFQELRNIWAQWDDEAKQLFYQNYGDLPYLLDVKEYTTLLRCPRIQGYKAYVRPASLPTFTKKLDLISTHLDVKKRVDVLALSIYGMVIFPKALGHIDEAVVNLFDRLGKQNTPVPAILAETIRSLSACRRAGEGRFIGCAQLLLEAADMPRRDDISEERWIDILQNLREEDVMWKAPWLVPSEVLYRCGSFDWAQRQPLSIKGGLVREPTIMSLGQFWEWLDIGGELTSDTIRVGGYEVRVREKEFRA